jgi:hypothetical protein
MADIKIPFASLGQPNSGIKLMNKMNEDVTSMMLKT